MALEFNCENELYNQTDFFPPMKDWLRNIRRKEEWKNEIENIPGQCLKQLK